LKFVLTFFGLAQTNDGEVVSSLRFISSHNSIFGWMQLCKEMPIARLAAAKKIPVKADRLAAFSLMRGC